MTTPGGPPVPGSSAPTLSTLELAEVSFVNELQTKVENFKNELTKILNLNPLIDPKHIALTTGSTYPRTEAQAIYTKLSDSFNRIEPKLTLPSLAKTDAEAIKTEIDNLNAENELKKLDLICKVDELIVEIELITLRNPTVGSLSISLNEPIAPGVKDQLDRLIFGPRGTTRDPNSLLGLVNTINRATSIDSLQADIERKLQTAKIELLKLEKGVLKNELNLDLLIKNFNIVIDDIKNKKALPNETDKLSEIERLKELIENLDKNIDGAKNLEELITLFNAEKTNYEYTLTEIESITNRINQRIETESETNRFNINAIDKGEVLGCLAIEPTAIAAQEFHDKVKAKLAEIRAAGGELVGANFILDTNRIIADAIINEFAQKTDHTNMSRHANFLSLYGNPKDPAKAELVINQLIEELKQPGKSSVELENFDRLVREAIAQATLKEYLKEIEAKITARFNEQKSLMSKVSPLFAQILGITGGTLTGAAIKYNLMQSVGINVGGYLAGQIGNTVASSVLMTRFTSGIAGALGGAVAGAISGAIGGVIRGKQEARNTSRVLTVLNRGILNSNTNEYKRLSSAEKAAMIEDLINGKEHKIGKVTLFREKFLDIKSDEDIKAIVEVIKAHYLEQARNELEAALAAVKADPQPLDPSDPVDMKVNLARAFSALLTVHNENSVQNRVNNLQLLSNFQAESKSVMYEQVGAGAKRGALYGAGIGAVFGFLFPANSDIAQTNAQRMINTHALDGVYDKIHDYAQMINNPDHTSTDILRAKAEAIKAAAQLPGGVDLGATLLTDNGYENVPEFKKSLLDLASEVANGPRSEMNLRALHQLLSHSQVTADSFQSFLALIQNPQSAHIHSGGELSQLLARGWDSESAQKMAHDIFNWLKKEANHPNQPHLDKINYLGRLPVGGEGSALIPGLGYHPMAEGHALLGMALASLAGYLTATRGERDNQVWWWNKNIEATAENAIKAEKSADNNEIKKRNDAKPYELKIKANALKCATDDGKQDIAEAFGTDGLREATTDYQKLLIQIPRNDRRFIFKLKDPNLGVTPDNIRVFRVWYGRHSGGLPTPSLGSAVHNFATDMLRQAGDTTAPSGILQTGQIQVKEYKLEDLFEKNPANELKPINSSLLNSKWEQNKWATNDKAPKTLDIADVLTVNGDELSAVIISPLEVAKYAFALANPKVSNLQLKVGQIPDDGIDKFLDDMDKNMPASTPGATAPTSPPTTGGTPIPPGAPVPPVSPAPVTPTAGPGSPSSSGTIPLTSTLILGGAPFPGRPPSTTTPPPAPPPPPPPGAGTPYRSPFPPSVASHATPIVTPMGPPTPFDPPNPFIPYDETVDQAAVRNPIYKEPFIKEFAEAALKRGLEIKDIEERAIQFYNDNDHYKQDEVFSQLKVAQAIMKVDGTISGHDAFELARTIPVHSEQSIEYLATTNRSINQLTEQYVKDIIDDYADLPDELKAVGINDVNDIINNKDDAINTLLPVMQTMVEKAKKIYEEFKKLP